ncbi:hypothetical protein [Microbacterium candidum]|uniref:Uncharacterized protein n=1 Tax=Microbacterium candidum TaxID=3041922 RepID=A0ABT7MVW2_9MICO|nr:hypothetical protein [Microbacterium sp. ASV49]MDL9978592.1 hypothetical protein [Microbacterium sp. ASV49]
MDSNHSAWRTNDVVAYDAMREAVNTAIALLMRLADEGAMLQRIANEEAAEIRREMLLVDGYDRTAIDAARATFDARVANLAGAAP